MNSIQEANKAASAALLHLMLEEVDLPEVLLVQFSPPSNFTIIQSWPCVLAGVGIALEGRMPHFRGSPLPIHTRTGNEHNVCHTKLFIVLQLLITLPSDINRVHLIRPRFNPINMLVTG